MDLDNRELNSDKQNAVALCFESDDENSREEVDRCDAKVTPNSKTNDDIRKSPRLLEEDKTYWKYSVPNNNFWNATNV